MPLNRLNHIIGNNNHKFHKDLLDFRGVTFFKRKCPEMGFKVKNINKI